MKLESKDLKYIVFIALLITMLLLQRSCNERNTNELVSNIAQYKTEAKHYQDKFNQEVSYNNSLQLSTQKQIKALLSKNDTLARWVKEFKSVQSGGIIKEVTTIREIPIPYETQIPCDFKPFQIKKTEKYFNFYGTISKDNLSIDSIFMPNEFSYVVGAKKTGFLGLGGKEYRMEVRNSNPYIVTTNIESYTFKNKPKWYETGIFKVSVGVALGYAIGRKF